MKKAAGPTVNGYLAAYKSGKLIANKLTAAEKTAEAYVKMKAVIEIGNLAKSIYNAKKAKYKQSKDPKDAALYLAAADIIFRALDADCKNAASFCKEVDAAWFSRILDLFGKNSADDLIKSIESIQNSANMKADEVATDWIYQLKTDYPKQYENYKSILDKKEAGVVYEIQCPVSVEVYNASGQKAASVTDHKAYWDGESDLVIAAIGDGATIWFYGEEDLYSIRYIGTDTGSMDVAVQKYDEQGNRIQNVQYHNVPLTADTVYSSEENLAYTGADYSLSNEADRWNPIDPDVNTANPVKEKRTVTVKNGFMVYDETEGCVTAAECYPGETITVYTASASDKKFSGWNASSGKVSFLDKNSPETSFVMPDEDVKIQAVYGTADQDGKKDDVQNGSPSALPAAGTVLTDSKTGIVYTVAKQGKSVLVKNPASKNAAKVVIPDTVKLLETAYQVEGIAANAFAKCAKLKSVSVGKNISSIGDKAFYNCKALSKITIPAKVAKIGKQAFAGCKKLKTIAVKTDKLTKKSVGAKAFQGIYAKAKITVPKKKKKAYVKLLKAKGIGKKVKIK